MISQSDISHFVKELVAKEQKTDISAIRDDSTFNELGLDSVNSVFLLSYVEEHYDVDIDPLSLFDNPTIDSFSAYLFSLINESH